MSRIYIVLLLSIFMISSNTYSQDEVRVLKGPYLGQKTPGSIPKVFAPGIVSAEHRDHSVFFTPDMKEFYFTRRDNKTGKWSLIVFKSENNQWRESVVGPRMGRPSISPDGKIMYLGNQYMERTETGWSEVKGLGSPIEDMLIMRLSASSNGTYYFDKATLDPDANVIRYSRLIDGKREEPRLLGKEINGGKWNAHPFIAPDESYLIWDGYKDSEYKNKDLYISFRQKDGSWGAAINMGDKINTKAGEGAGYVTPDGKYFFFNRHEDIYWVDANIIEALRSGLISH